MSQSESRFREMFEVLHNIDLEDLETAGVIKPNAIGGSDWRRFNNDLTTFVLKLPAARVDALAKLVESRLARPSTADRGGEVEVKALEWKQEPNGQFLATDKG